MTMENIGKKRQTKQQLIDIPLSPEAEKQIATLCQSLLKKMDREDRAQRYAKASLVLKLVGAGAFIAGSLAFPTLPLALKPFLDASRQNEQESWKRFNLTYLKRTLNRLEKEKLVEVSRKGNADVVTLTQRGKRRVLTVALDDLAIEKPKAWDGTWWLVSYDIPHQQDNLRRTLREYLRAWRFYPLHESMYLHAYPCYKEVVFLREYLGIGEFVRILRVSEIENDALFRDFFGV